MPQLSIILIRFSLLYLLAGLGTGCLFLSQKGFPFSQSAKFLLPVHIELMAVGWVVQFVIGVAFWMLPKFVDSPTRGNETPVRLALYCLNLGVLFICVGQVVGAPPLLGTCGRLLELAAVFFFSRNVWPRVKPVFIPDVLI
jgi:hypothetical protein